MSDIVKRLRDWPRPEKPSLSAAMIGTSDLCKEAADEIGRLRLALTGIATCSTCDVCRAAALRTLDGSPPGLPPSEPERV